MYKIVSLFVQSGKTAQIELPYTPTNTNELFIIAIPTDSGIPKQFGSITSWISAGKCTQINPNTFEFSGANVGDYKVFIANISDPYNITTPTIEQNKPFPARETTDAIATLIKAVQELQAEYKRILRVPENETPQVFPLIEQRAGKVAFFDKNGNVSAGFTEIAEIAELANRLEAAVSLCKNYEQKASQAEQNAKASEDKAKESETNAKESEDKAKESETNAKEAEQNARKIETEILLTEVRIDEKAAEYLIRLEEYKYVVLTREGYDNLQTKDPDTIYFVKGNTDYSELVEELLNSQQEVLNYTGEIANRLDQEITARQQTMERVNELETDLSTALVDVAALEERVNVRADALEKLISDTNSTYTKFSESVAQALVLLDTTATLTQQGVVKLSTPNVIQNGSPVGVNADGQLSVPVANANYAGAVRTCTNTVQTLDQCGWTGKSSNGELLVLKPALTGTAMRFGAVRIADNLDDTNAHACMTASQIKSTLNGWAQFFATDNSPSPNDMGIHGKALFASQNGDNGGVYIGGNKNGNVSWTQWTTRYQRDKIRVYGKDNGVYEDFYLEPSDVPENQKLQIARIKDIPTIDVATLVDLASDQQITGTKTIMGKWFRFAFDDVDLEQGGAVEMSGSRGGVYFKISGSQYFATLNLYGLIKNETIAFKSDIPDITGKADQTALDALIARVSALEAAATE